MENHRRFKRNKKNLSLQNRVTTHMNNLPSINIYENILNTTNKMLAAAQNNEWDQLVDLEQECRKLTVKLMPHNTEHELNLSEELQQQKVKIIHQVLANHAQIRTITEPRMAQLQDTLSTTKCERNLLQAYHPNNKI